MSLARILQDAHLRIDLPLPLDVALWKAIAYTAGASAFLVGGVYAELTTLEQDRPHDTEEDHGADPEDVSIVYVYPGMASTATSLLHTLSTAFVGAAGLAALFSPLHTANIRDLRRAGLALAIASGVACIMREILEKRRLWGLQASGVRRLSLARSLHIACAVPLVLAECDTTAEPSDNALVTHAAAALGAFATGKWMVRFQQSELGSWLLHARAQARSPGKPPAPGP